MRLCHCLHRLNLAAQIVFEEFEVEIKKVNELMVELRTLKNRAKLRKHTNLQPEIKNQTRWSSTFMMLLKYERIEKYLEKCEFDNHVLSKIPTAVEKQRIITLIKALKEFESVAKTLQEDNPKIDLYLVRTLFDELTEYFMNELGIDLSVKIGWDASIVHDQVFENAVVKVQSGKENELTVREAAKLVKFLKPNAAEIHETPSDTSVPVLSLAERVKMGIQKEKKIKVNSTSRYRSLKHLPSTSNLVERLFSSAGSNMTDYRKNMDPRSLEANLYLVENREFWGPATIDAIFKKNCDSPLK